MKPWKRILFSVISLIWGYISLDYLYYSMKLVCMIDGVPFPKFTDNQQAWQLIGAVMFIFWLIISAIYLRFVNSQSFKISIVEKDPKTGKDKIHLKWFDFLLQVFFIITGIGLRVAYLFLYYFPYIK